MARTAKSAVLLPGKTSKGSQPPLRADVPCNSMETHGALASENLGFKSYYFLTLCPQSKIPPV